MSGKYANSKDKRQSEFEAVKIIKYLVSKGADLHATDSSANRRNALHLAAIGGRPRVIHALVELGLDIDSRDRMNVTPLIQAAGSGCIEAVKACVELGADINARMNGPRTALDAAYEFGTEEAYKWGKVVCKDHQEIIAYLKKHGAKRASEIDG
jgi:ankyrin repeat protein